MRLKFVILFFAIAVMIAVTSSCQNEGEMTYNRYYSVGSTIYNSHCQNCHGVNAEGLNSLIPPFTDSVYLRKNLSQLPCFVKNGLKDTIVVVGKKFSGIMPPQNSLSPIEIAEVLTYITNSFGNKIGLVDVAKVERDLQECK